MGKKTKSSVLLEGIGKEQLQKLCDFFNVTKESLSRSLVQTDGVTRINLLKLSFRNPEEWRVIYDNINTVIHQPGNTDEFLDSIKNIYTAQTGNVILKKYKKSIKNDTRILYEMNCFEELVNEMQKTDDPETLEFYANLLYEHSLLLLCDIGMIEPIRRNKG